MNVDNSRLYASRMESAPSEMRSLTSDTSSAYLTLCQNNTGKEGNTQCASTPQMVEICIASDDYSKRFTIGRSINQNLQISRTRDGKEVISRRHAEIYRRPDGHFYLQDLKTLNGTFINDVKIGDHVLREGDVIQFAGHANVDIGKMLTSSKVDFNLRYRFSTHAPVDFTTPLANRTPSSEALGSDQSRVSNIKTISTNKEIRTNSNFSDSRGSGSSIRKGKEKRSKLQSKRLLGSPTLSSLSAVPSAMDTIQHHRPTDDDVEKTVPHRKFIGGDNDGNVVDFPRIHEVSSIVANRTELRPSVAGVAATMLDLGTLKQKVSCTLCTQPFVDAVVARCSHGFCRACLEKHLRTGKSSCPICNSPPLKYYKRLAKKCTSPLSSSSSRKERRPLFYHRSDHLDNIVFLLLETENNGGMDLFKSREKKDHEYLRSVGVDPFSNPGLYEEELDARTNGKGVTNIGGGVLSSARRRSRDKNTREISICSRDDSDEAEYSDFSDDSNVIKRKRARLGGGVLSKKPICEYCAESDHEFPDCPHRKSDDEGDSSSLSD